MGQPDQAVNHYNQALPIHREIGDRAGEATTLNNIGGIYFDQGDLETTIKHLDRALQLFDAIGDRANGTMVSFNLATLKAQTGDTATARSAIDRAIELAQQSRHPALPQMQAFQQNLTDER